MTPAPSGKHIAHWELRNSAVGPMAVLSSLPDQFIIRASSIGGVPLRRQHVAEESLGGSGLWTRCGLW